MSRLVDVPGRPPIDPAGFVELVAAAYPDLRAELEEDAGLECVQTGTFCDHTQAAIDRGDMGVVATCFGIADRVIANGDDSMVNAIHVAFLEHLDFRGPHGKPAFEMLSPALREGWIDINQYMGPSRRRCLGVDVEGAADVGRHVGADGCGHAPEQWRVAVEHARDPRLRSGGLDDWFRIDVCAGMGATESGARSGDGAYPPIRGVADRRARRRVATTSRVCGSSESIT